MTVKNYNEINQNVELILADNRPMASSLEVAEHFGKRHAVVLRAIQQLQKTIPNRDFFEHNFVAIEITVAFGRSGGTRKSPAYLMTKDGFYLLGFGFTGSRAVAWKLRYIQAFNDMDAALNKKQATAQFPLHDLCFVEETAKERLNRHLGIIEGCLGFWAFQDNIPYQTAEKMLCTHLNICGMEEFTSERFNDAWSFVIQHACYLCNEGEEIDEHTKANLHKLFQSCLCFRHIDDLNINKILRSICRASIANMPMADPQKLLNLAWGLFHYSYGFNSGREYTLQEVLAHANQ